MATNKQREAAAITAALAINPRSLDPLPYIAFNLPTCRYDVILGRNDIAKLGIKLNVTDQMVEWLNHSIPMRSTTRSIPEPLQEAIDSELFASEPIKILKHNYKSVTATLVEITEAQKHLGLIEK